MEGVGKKAGIGHRKWVGDMDQGGQLLDMSTHLLSFTTMLENHIGDLKIENVIPAVCVEAEQEYLQWNGRYSDKMAETYAIVKGTTKTGCKVSFEFGKYTGVAERKFVIVGEREEKSPWTSKPRQCLWILRFTVDSSQQTLTLSIRY